MEKRISTKVDFNMLYFTLKCLKEFLSSISLFFSTKGGTLIINFYLLLAATNFPKHYSRNFFSAFVKIDNLKFFCQGKKEKFSDLFKLYGFGRFFPYTNYPGSLSRIIFVSGFIRVQIILSSSSVFPPKFEDRNFIMNAI